MPSLLSLADPHIASAAIARHPQLAWPVAALFVTCVLLGVTVTLTQRLHGRRSFTEKAVERPVSYYLSMMSPILLIVLTVWLWATFFSLLILRLLHRDAGFDLLACLNGYTLSPLLFALLADPLRSLSRRWYRTWQIMAAGMLLWFVADLWIGLAVGCHVSYGQAGLAGAPALLCLVTVCLLYGRTPPDTYRAVYPWHRVATDHLIVYSDRELSSSLAGEIITGCAATLQSVIEFLEVEPPPYPIEIFLYADEALRKRMAGNANRIAWAAADSIHVPYDSWSRMHGTVAHELTHVMRQQRITRTPIALLEEGLATYTEAQLVRGSTYPPCITLENSLHVLANQTVFYEWLHMQTSENTASEKYAHAHALTRYLVQTSGIKAYKDLCRTAGSSKGTEPERLSNAVQTIYHVSLKELEQKWRDECGIVESGPHMAWAWFNQATANCITNARVKAVSAWPTVPSQELLAQLLQDKRNVAYRLLVHMEIEISTLLHAITGTSGVEKGQQKPETVFSVPARHAIDQAVKEAVRQNAHFVGSEHLLLGLLQAGTGNAYDILTAAGLNLTGAREALEAIYRQAAADNTSKEDPTQNKAS